MWVIQTTVIIIVYYNILASYEVTVLNRLDHLHLTHVVQL